MALTTGRHTHFRIALGRCDLRIVVKNDEAGYGQLLTYLETEDSRVVAMMIPKYPLPTVPVGNPQTTKVATVAMINLAQKAYSQGLRT
jgi:hypothetical protein